MTIIVTQPPPTMYPPPRHSRASRSGRVAAIKGGTHKAPHTLAAATIDTVAPKGAVPELRRAGTMTEIPEDRVTTILPKEEEEEAPVSPVSVAQPLRLQRKKQKKRIQRASTLPEEVLHANQQRLSQAAASTSSSKETSRRSSLSMMFDKITEQLSLLVPAEAEEEEAPMTRREKAEAARLARMEQELQRFQYSQRDIVSILKDREAFKTLQLSLRQRSCVTNTYLKLNVHFYVEHVKTVREARMRDYKTQSSRPRNPNIMSTTAVHSNVNINQNIMPTMRDRD